MNTTLSEPEEHIYKLKTDDLTWFQIWRKRAMPLLPGAVPFGFGLIVVINLLRGNDLNAARLVGIAIYTVVATLILGAISMLSYRRNMWRLRAYELHVADDQIAQRMPNVPDLAVRKEEVTRITESRYGLSINTHQRHKRLVIWPTVEGYEEIKRHVAAWQPIQEDMSGLPRWYRTLRIVVIIAMIALFVTDKPVIVVPAALVPLGFMIYGLIELPRQSKVLRSERFLYRVLFSFWIVIIVWRMLTVLG